MERSKRIKRDIRKLQETSRGGYYISLPTSLVRELRWQDRQKLVVRRYGKGLLIEDWDRRKS